MCKTTNNKEGSPNLKQRMVLGFPVKEKRIKKKTHKERERERERERMYYVFVEREKYDWQNAKSGEPGVQSEGYKSMQEWRDMQAPCFPWV
jgi:hypothetical protein